MVPSMWCVNANARASLAKALQGLPRGVDREGHSKAVCAIEAGVPHAMHMAAPNDGGAPQPDPNLHTEPIKRYREN